MQFLYDTKKLLYAAMAEIAAYSAKHTYCTNALGDQNEETLMFL
jgi:hypothetical protein